MGKISGKDSSNAGSKKSSVPAEFSNNALADKLKTVTINTNTTEGIQKKGPQKPIVITNSAVPAINQKVTSSAHKNPPSSAVAKQQLSWHASDRTITNAAKLIYNASKRTTAEIEADFRDPRSSFNKRKGILDGVTYCLNRLSEKGNSDRQRMADMQQLKREFEQTLQAMIKNPSGQSSQGRAAVTIKKPGVTSKTVENLFGNKDQFIGANSLSETCDVVIGLDFGTACSKVIVRTPEHFGNQAFLIPFGQYSHTSSIYLLPTHLSINNIQYYLPKTDELGNFSDLKMLLIESLTSLKDGDHLDNVIAYLALLLRYVRTWFLKEQKQAYGEFSLLWQLNVGVPSATAECDELCHLYQRVIYLAWQLSISEGAITPQLMKQIRESIYSLEKPDNNIEFITVYPEVAAEVAGYTQSDMRQEGLHMLVDVGAGTLDVCGFNVHRHNGENVLPLFSTSVERLGVSRLHEVRQSAVEKCLREKIDQLMPEPASPLTVDCSEYAPAQELFISAARSSEEIFLKACSNQIYRVVHCLRHAQAPDASSWNGQFRVFLCGGGSLLEQYKGLLGVLKDRIKANIVGNCQIVNIKLARPSKLVAAITDDEYHRYAVAWGLSYRSFDLDRVITNIKPVKPFSRAESDQRAWYERGPDYLMDDTK